MKGKIRVRGARQNNLKGLNVDIPRGALTVLTGPSGSGKSSLAFDTIYAEGQRRYVESLSTYAKQFLERMPKPDVDFIDGISPSVSIDQRNSVRSSRSSVGTVTEVYDYLRLLWARVGRTVCPDCRKPVLPDTVHSATERILSLTGGRVMVTFPVGDQGRPSARQPDRGRMFTFPDLLARGYLRVVLDGRLVRLEDLDEENELSRAVTSEVLVVVDRLRLRGEAEHDMELRGRVADAVAAAFAEGEGRLIALVAEDAADGAGEDAADGAGEPPFTQRLTFEESMSCRGCGRAFAPASPLLFSFNHPTGACETCNGFGATLEYDESLIVPEPGRSLDEGALDPWSKPRYTKERAAVLAFAEAQGVDIGAPWRELPASVRNQLLHGGPDFQGMIPFLRSRERKRYKQYIRVFLRQYQRPQRCPACAGARLRPESLAVQVAGFSIAQVADLTIDQLGQWFSDLDLSSFEAKLAATIVEELSARTSFLVQVGLGYLTLARQTRSLSGGEMQRIRLAGSLGSHLVDTLYVLDEPTIGLHPRDVQQFLSVLRALRDRGNTVLVVEHEPAVFRAADHLLELGPGSGEHGGELVFAGRPAGLAGAGTATGRGLARSDAKRPDVRAVRRTPCGALRLEGARLHNVQDVDLDVPLQTLTVVTGVSGSGKSTLVHDILFHALEKELAGASSAREHLGEEIGSYRRLDGVGHLDDVVLVDQSPIGRTSRSNPVTYIGAYGELRRLYAAQPLAHERGYGPGTFSFNVDGGRCAVCKGAGEEVIEMVFLADVAVPCEACDGRRFRPEVLEVTVRELNIHQALQLTVDEAIRVFVRQDKFGQALWQLQRVGLGYLRLGQPATTLSGGESQRLKIARELARRSGRARRLYVMDEPTTGLGVVEIRQLVDVLDQLIDKGHSVLVIEHNLDVIARADWVIDMGPEAAAAGGRIVATGTPEEVARNSGSHTGRYLAAYLAGGHAGEAAQASASQGG